MSFRKATWKCIKIMCLKYYFTLPFSLAILLLGIHSKEIIRHRHKYLHKDLVLSIVMENGKVPPCSFLGDSSNISWCIYKNHLEGTFMTCFREFQTVSYKIQCTIVWSHKSFFTCIWLFFIYVVLFFSLSAVKSTSRAINHHLCSSNS